MARLPDPVEAGLKGDAADLYAELKEKRGRIDGMYRTMLNRITSYNVCYTKLLRTPLRNRPVAFSFMAT